jgi:hypothetical protein
MDSTRGFVGFKAKIKQAKKCAVEQMPNPSNHELRGDKTSLAYSFWVLRPLEAELMG